MPQREFARRVGVAQSTIMRIENHEQNVTLDTLEQLCRAFRVDIEELFPVPAVRRQYGRDEEAARAGFVHEPKARGPSSTASSPGTSPSGSRGRRRKPRV